MNRGHRAELYSQPMLQSLVLSGCAACWSIIKAFYYYASTRGCPVQHTGETRSESRGGGQRRQRVLPNSVVSKTKLPPPLEKRLPCNVTVSSPFNILTPVLKT